MMTKFLKENIVYQLPIEILKDVKDKELRTILASPLMAAATAVEGKITDITKQLK